MSRAGLLLWVAVVGTPSDLPPPRLPSPNIDTPAVALPPLRVIGQTPARCSMGFRLHVGRAYGTWARELAQAWQGIPYGSGGSGTGPHELLLNFMQMDCMTAVENLLALHLAHKAGTPTMEGLAYALLGIRYVAYPPCRWEDRIHYLTHAFMVWEGMGWGTWLPLGQVDARPIRYISAHPQRYRGFTDWQAIQKVEKLLSTRPRYFIPTQEIGHWLSALQDGDIIAFISSEEGLDVSHVGIFFWEEGKATFAHASLKARKWVWGEDLCAYLDRRQEKVQGITVFRPFL